MGDRLYENQFTWVINNFSSLQYDEKIYSDVFVIDGCNWRVVATLKGNKYDESLYLSLAVPDAESLPFGWRRRAEFSFTIRSFDYNTPERGCASSIPLGKLDAKYCGLIFDEQVKIFGELDVLEVICKSEPISIELHGYVQSSSVF
ncbi:PREDICTED: MATH domain and coiled-coil domain-containing protein At3g58370-like [Camelina sativa]|uniref:MATH domain and coiled-coil domain-containing protein At3g58370-like n=1 Tax=Camelina sativa TaxID=90675 RepID=A0ABM0YXJ5_CAMSA|nr:PREDICTED: MATH domain and coiled-coil domain-containing protein At3g58370-like [Camelina sativa]